MPGIVGLVTKMPREWAEPQLLRMVEASCHEAFYGTGTWIDASLGIYVGWIVRKNCFADGMPLSNKRGDVVLVFSGEEYRDPVAAHNLNRWGDAHKAGESTYLVDLYDKEPSFPAGLNGRFHGLLTDQTRATATLFNDRFGMHRIYYHESEAAFYFAAEAKAILKVRPELRRADPRGLAEFVACGCVLENRTFFEGIQLLPPAAAWVFRGGTLERKGAYFRPSDWEDQEPLESESYYRELRDAFSRILPRYFDGGERIGMSLTGGLDTRMIMAWHKPPPGSLPCYSFGGAFRDSQDVILARHVARMCGQAYQVIPVGDKFLSHFAHYAERAVYLTDGCAGVAHAADLYVNERAREIAPVRMTGNYGGEVLRWVRAFKAVDPLPGLFPEFEPYLRQARETYNGLLRGHPLSFSVFKQAPWHHYGLLALEQTQLSLRSPFLDNEIVRTVYRAPESSCVNNDVSLRLIADGDPALMRIRTDRGLAGNRGLLTSWVSRRLLNFSNKAEYAYGDGMPQWLARIDHSLAPFRLDRLFLGRHKFAHFRIWYRDVLSGYVREMLLDSKTLSRPYLDGRLVELVVAGQLKGNRNYSTEIHQVLTLELLHRLFLDST